MGKVMWTEARALYCSDESISYSMIAKVYKVAKSTIQRRATRENWPALRVHVRERAQAKLLELTSEKIAEIEERHISRLRMIQDVAAMTVYRIGKKTENDTASVRDINKLASATITLKTAIMAERKLLGMRTAPVTFKNPEDIEEYQIMMGFKEGPPDRTYKETKKTIETLDRIIERRQMLQSLIDEVDDRGYY